MEVERTDADIQVFGYRFIQVQQVALQFGGEVLPHALLQGGAHGVLDVAADVAAAQHGADVAVGAVLQGVAHGLQDVAFYGGQLAFKRLGALGDVLFDGVALFFQAFDVGLDLLAVDVVAVGQGVQPLARLRKEFVQRLADGVVEDGFGLLLQRVERFKKRLGLAPAHADGGLRRAAQRLGDGSLDRKSVV